MALLELTCTAPGCDAPATRLVLAGYPCCDNTEHSQHLIDEALPVRLVERGGLCWPPTPSYDLPACMADGPLKPAFRAPWWRRWYAKARRAGLEAVYAWHRRQCCECGRHG